MAHFGKALGQDMLEKASQELGRRQSEPLEFLRAVVAVTERHLSVLESLQARVAQGDAKDVTSQIFQDFFSAPGRLGVDNPFLGSPKGRHAVQQPSGFESITYFGSKDEGKSAHRDEEVGVFGFQPALAVGRQSAGADQ